MSIQWMCVYQWYNDERRPQMSNNVQADQQLEARGWIELKEWKRNYNGNLYENVWNQHNLL